MSFCGMYEYSDEEQIQVDAEDAIQKAAASAAAPALTAAFFATHTACGDYDRKIAHANPIFAEYAYASHLSPLYVARVAYSISMKTGSTEQEASVAAYEGALAAATYTAAIEAKAPEGLVEPVNYEGLVGPPSSKYAASFILNIVDSYLKSELPEYYTKLQNKETPIDYAEISKAAKASAHSYYTKLAANPIRAKAAKTARAAAEKAIAFLRDRDKAEIVALYSFNCNIPKDEDPNPKGPSYKNDFIKYLKYKNKYMQLKNKY